MVPAPGCSFDRARHSGRPGRQLLSNPARRPAGSLAHRGLRTRAVARGHHAARGRPVRRRAGEGGELMHGAAAEFVLLADSGEAKKAGPLALAIVLVLFIACYFLFRSMSRHLRKVRTEFPVGASTAEPPAGSAPNRPADE